MAADKIGSGIHIPRSSGEAVQSEYGRGHEDGLRMADERNLRVTALQLAVSTTGADNAAPVIYAAQAYYDFLSGKPEVAPARTQLSTDTESPVADSSKLIGSRGEMEALPTPRIPINGEPDTGTTVEEVQELLPAEAMDILSTTDFDPDAPRVDAQPDENHIQYRHGLAAGNTLALEEVVKYLVEGGFTRSAALIRRHFGLI